MAVVVVGGMEYGLCPFVKAVLKVEFRELYCTPPEQMGFGAWGRFALHV